MIKKSPLSNSIKQSKHTPTGKSGSKELSENATPPSLSKSIMSMKFMKRKEELEDEKKEERKRRKLENSMNEWNGPDFNDENNQMLIDNSLDNENKSNLITSVIVEHKNIYAALPGRRSFGGFNKNVEREYERQIDEEKFDKAMEKAKKNTVSDEEMLSRYQNLIGLPRGPNQGKAPPQSGKHMKK